MRDIVVGIDIGGTNTVIGLVGGTGDILGQANLRTKSFEHARGFVEGVTEACNVLVGDFKAPLHISAVGIGAPNGNYYNGEISEAPNLRWGRKVPLAAMMEQSFETPCVLTNDANAAAIGEMIYGNAKGMKNFIVVTIGTGLGSGIVVNGDVVYGNTGFAGELGHTIAVRGGRLCSCGRHGCLEAYVSARGLRQTVDELLEGSGRDSLLRKVDPRKRNAKSVFDAAERGDALAKEAFALTGEILGMQLADAVAYTSPEAIFLFGGISKAGDHLMNSTRACMDANLLNIFRGRVKLLPSALNERNGAILGAAALARKEFCQD
jgi:glucokinase